MKIKSGKTTYDLTIEDLASTVRDLKVRLMEMTNFADIKLIHAGKVLHDDEVIGNIPGGDNAKLTMIGSTSAALEELHESEQKSLKNKRIIDDLSPDNQRNNKVTALHTSGPKQHNPYKFESIQTLPNLPDEHKAREILTALANDEGILAVMKKHKWTVGALCELYPEGYVGVSDVCVMGLNENHGQRILLRLRTDDLKGFRKILSIRKVLCHELAHNVHSEHDDNFYVLMRQVEREIVELDWKNSKARTLGGVSHDTYTPLPAPVAAAPAVHILGGSTDPLLQQLVPARYLAGTAAIMRLSAEEKEVEDNCASGRVDVIRSPRLRAAAGEGQGAQEEKMQVDGGPAPAIVEESVHPEKSLRDQPTPEIVNVDPETTTDEPMQVDASRTSSTSSLNGSQVRDATHTEPTAEEKRAPSVSQLLPSAVQHDPPVEFGSIREKILNNIDESIAFALSTESAAAPIEKMLALREAVEAVLAHIESDGDGSQNERDKCAKLQACLKVLLQLVTNAKDSTDPKYRTVKTTNKVYQRDVATVNGAEGVLFCAGFSRQGESLLLTRHDVGLLYVVASTLQAAVEVVDGGAEGTFSSS